MTVHERDCAPCDAACAVVDAFAEEFDRNDVWRDYEYADGTTEYDRLVAKIAAVLHRFPMPGGQP